MDSRELVPWTQVQKFLARLLGLEVSKLARAKPEEMQVAQGRVQVLMELQQLREVVTSQSKEA